MNLIEEKIQKIAKEMQEANASQWTITKIIKELNQVNKQNEKKLRKIALEKLKELDPEAGQIYETFSKMKVYTSLENIENFDRGNILKSLLKETKISRSIAEKITLEIENQIKDSKINFLTTSLIRELVNAKLITYGLEEIRNDYARLGEPVFEIKQKMEKKPLSNIQTKEYNLLKIIPSQIRKKHFEGKIFIEDLSGFSTRFYTYSLISKKQDSLQKTIIYNIKKILNEKKIFYLTPNLYGLTFVTAPFLKNQTQTKKASLLIKQLLEIPPQNFVNSLELFTPRILSEYSEYKIKAAELSNLLLDNKSVVQVDSKFCLKLIKPKGNFLILNNYEKEFFALNNNLFSTTQGLDFFVNINLESLLDDDEEKFFLKIDETIEDIKQLKQIKQKITSTKKYLEKYTNCEMKTGIGLTNLFKLSKQFSEKKNKEIANKIYKKFSKENDFNLFGIASNNAKNKFEQILRKKVFSHDEMFFEECLNSKKCCFTGKVSTIKETEILLDKKIKQIHFEEKN